jgi:undecaprenyl-diphosphatase
MVLAGILQGILEWLPLSSSKQISRFLDHVGQSNIATSASFFLQLGTVFAAIVFFRKEIINTLSFKDEKTLQFLFYGVSATAIVGFPLMFLINNQITESFLAFGIMLALGLILGVLAIMNKLRNKTEEPNKNSGFLTGLAQGFSAISGVSRTGTTTFALLLQGYEIEHAFKLSFILGIPTIILANILFLFLGKIQFIFSLGSLLALGFSFAFGLLFLHLFFFVVKRFQKNPSLLATIWAVFYIAAVFLFFAFG